MESLGTKLRRQRRRLGFTLDELAGLTGISKPYLSLIETGRVANPPSDEKLRRLEQTLQFKPNELLSQAHLQRTPRDVRAMLQKLLQEQKREGSGVQGSGKSAAGTALLLEPRTLNPEPSAAPLNLDDAYLSGALRELVETSAPPSAAPSATPIAPRPGAGQVMAVPVVNKVSAGYPKDFTDLSYPPRVADGYVGCPDLNDPDAFAARVHGDSMVPKYREGDVVIFSPAAGPRDGDDCFVRFEDGQTTFKRAFFETGDGGAPVVRLQPRNETYRPQVVPRQHITGLFRAVWRFQRVDQD